MKRIVAFLCMFTLLIVCICCGMTDEEEREAANKAKILAKMSMETLKIPMYCQRDLERYNLNEIGKLYNYNAIEIRLKEADLAAQALDSLPRNMKYLKPWTAFRDEARYLMGLTIDFLEDFKKILEKSKKGRKIDDDVNEFNTKVNKYKGRYQKLEPLYNDISQVVIK